MRETIAEIVSPLESIAKENDFMKVAVATVSDSIEVDKHLIINTIKNSVNWDNVAKS